METKRQGTWWQRIGITKEVRQELRLQLLTQHSVYPKCSSCVNCTGFHSKNKEVLSVARSFKSSLFSPRYHTSAPRCTLHRILSACIMALAANANV